MTSSAASSSVAALVAAILLRVTYHAIPYSIRLRGIIPISSSHRIDRHGLYGRRPFPDLRLLIAGYRALPYGNSPTPILLCRGRYGQLQPRRRAVPRLATLPLAANTQTRKRTRHPPLRPVGGAPFVSPNSGKRFCPAPARSFANLRPPAATSPNTKTPSAALFALASFLPLRRTSCPHNSPPLLANFLRRIFLLWRRSPRPP
jgi:hypothetical protein